MRLRPRAWSGAPDPTARAGHGGALVATSSGTTTRFSPTAGASQRIARHRGHAAGNALPVARRRRTVRHAKTVTAYGRSQQPCEQRFHHGPYGSPHASGTQPKTGPPTVDRNPPPARGPADERRSPQRPRGRGTNPSGCRRRPSVRGTAHSPTARRRPTWGHAQCRPSSRCGKAPSPGLDRGRIPDAPYSGRPATTCRFRVPRRLCGDT